MTFSTHNARLTETLDYRLADGTAGQVPAGACLVEQADQASVDIVWGPTGESSARLGVAAVKGAVDSGLLVLLD